MTKVTIDRQYMTGEGLTSSVQQIVNEKVRQHLVTLVTYAALSQSRDRVGNGDPACSTLNLQL